ncbi:hypothetical protein PsorP6_018834 [Peronosclerospora sorghi]|nr:hypothetical protein PsorP6_018834 [Peronosclerospora sorghi]
MGKHLLPVYATYLIAFNIMLFSWGIGRNNSPRLLTCAITGVAFWKRPRTYFGIANLPSKYGAAGFQFSKLFLQIHFNGNRRFGLKWSPLLLLKTDMFLAYSYFFTLFGSDVQARIKSMVCLHIEWYHQDVLQKTLSHSGIQRRKLGDILWSFPQVPPPKMGKNWHNTPFGFQVYPDFFLPSRNSFNGLYCLWHPPYSPMVRNGSPPIPISFRRLEIGTSLFPRV